MIALPKSKVFCIGRNKTGTTSVAAALKQLGYRVANQQEGELLIEDWAKRDFRSLIAYCKKYEAFQDSPFSRHFTYQAMDMAFPGSKYILTIRETPEEWYESVVRFHSLRFYKRSGERRLPTADELKNDQYLYPGYLWRVRELTGGADQVDPYNRQQMISNYLDHNKQVEEYFRHRPHDLLILNLSKSDSMKKLCSFLGHSFNGQAMPHLNKST
jgi:hypothetical protein